MVKQKDYFKELYECKKELLNELLVLKKIKEALEYSQLNFCLEYDEQKIKKLQDDLKDMEVDLKE